MRYDTARDILRDLPKHWSTESKGLKPEYAKQLLENKLIEEVEPGKYRTTQDGTYWSKIENSYYTHCNEMRKLYYFTYEEIDLTPFEYRLQELVNKRAGEPFDFDTIDEKLRSYLGSQACG